MPTLQQVISIINEDQTFFEALVNELMGQRRAHQDNTLSIIEAIVTESVADENGYIKPGSLTDENLDTLEANLLDLYSIESLEDKVLDAMVVVDARLITIDNIMEALELDTALLGSEVEEFEFVQESIEDIAGRYAVGAEGDEDYQGSISMIQDSMNRYRYDRDKEEHILREEMVETLRVAGNAGENYANSHAITAMAYIDRELKRAQADRAGITHGLYAGIYDDIIRPFCNIHLGIVRPYSEWDEMSNDMPEGLYDKPVSLCGGGFNCRHRIIPHDLAWSNGETDLRDQFT